MSTNPFATKTNTLKYKEIAQRAVLFIGTYTIVLFTLFIFGYIIYKGAKPVFQQYGADFITRKPETLEVVGFDKGKKLEINQESFKTLTSYNRDPALISNTTKFKKPFKFINFAIEPNSIIGDGYLSEIENDNDFIADYIRRETNKEIGFEVTKDSILNLTQDTAEKLKNSATVFNEIEQRDLEIEKSTYKVSFEMGNFKMQAKTINNLQGTSLIYFLFGNLKDTMDDTPSALMNLEIKEKQEILLTPAQHSALISDSGNSTYSTGAVVKTKTIKKYLTLPKGSYNMPFNLFAEILEQNPAANVWHMHNLEKGSISINLDTTSDTLILPESYFNKMVADNPGLNISNIQPIVIEEDYVRFDFPSACEIQLPTSDMSAFKMANEGNVDEHNQKAQSILNEHVHPYSSGGIAGPLIGTGLLVIACMIIALFIGVAAAIYLGEYSRQGKLISIIRLAMLNLAGVPSIVFGIFGLGLFVAAAPKLTDTPSIESAITIPVLPSFSEPSLRHQENNKIIIIANDQNKTHALKAAQHSSYKKYYTGWYYISIEGWGNSILAGAFTLAMMVLPIIITSSEESLRAVPNGFREASLALGASKWQSIRTAVLPYATPGILTASVLGITRVAGETAPIMFTAAVAEKSELPFGVNGFLEFISQSVQAMPYHIYTVAGKIPQSEYNKPMQYGSVLVFMVVVMAFAALSVFLRMQMRKKYKW